MTHGSMQLLPFSTTCRYSRAAESGMDFPAGTLIAVTDGKLLMVNNKSGGGGSFKTLGAGNAGDCDGQNGWLKASWLPWR